MRVLLFSITLLFITAQVAFAGMFNAQTARLENGLQIVLVENHRAPVVTQMLWYKVGRADEPAGQSGLTHFLEHLMFKGTDKVLSGEFSKRISSLGGEDNAFTTQDSTTYYQSIARQYLPVIMAMESDRMQNLRLGEQDIEAERQVILQERKQRYDNNPTGRFWELVNERVFAGHPYNVPVIGWEDDIKGLTKDQIMAYYKKWYVPNNAVLVVSGDIAMAELLPLAQKYYGDIQPNWELPVRHPELFPIVRDMPEAMVKHDPQVKQSIWARIYPTPRLTAANPVQSDALSVLADILGGGPTGILYQNLVVDKKLAAQASASYDGLARGIGQFTISVIPLDGVALSDIDAAVDALLADLVQKGVNADVIRQSKEKIITQSDYARDSLDGPPSIIGNHLISDVPLSELERFPERIQAVDKISVDTILGKLVASRADERFYPPVTAYLLPETLVKEQ